jgi:hypothetical protein
VRVLYSGPMATRLVVVEEAFTARGPGVLVSPRFTAENPPRGTFPVRLVLPSGGEKHLTASLEVAHMRGALPPYAMVRLLGVTPDDVPPGTEIWTA